MSLAPGAKPKILVVDDNPRIRSFLRPALEDAGFEYAEAIDGWTAMEKVDQVRPDLIVLDIMLGDERFDGIRVCETLRQRGVITPVVFLTVLDRGHWPTFLPRAFKAGGDDFMEKRDELLRLQANERRLGATPSEVIHVKSDVAELIARIRARLPDRSSVIEVGAALRVDRAAERVTVNRGEGWTDARLTATEFALLVALIERTGPVGKGQLLDILGLAGDEHDIEAHVSRLRRKIEPEPEEPVYIVTYHRVGYRFQWPAG